MHSLRFFEELAEVNLLLAVRSSETLRGAGSVKSRKDGEMSEKRLPQRWLNVNFLQLAKAS